MTDNDTDLREPAQELSQSRAEGRELATVPEPAPEANGADADEGMSLKADL